MQSERQIELFEEICGRLRATDETARAEVEKQISKISVSLERNEAEAEAAKDAPTLGEARKRRRAEVKHAGALLKFFDAPEFSYGTATDNQFADSADSKQDEKENEEMLHNRRAAKAALEKYLPIFRKQTENPNWELKGSSVTTDKMKGGTLASNFVANCVKMFEAFRPSQSTWTPAGDLYVVTANIYERITGRSLLEENHDFSLEYRLKQAVLQFRRTPRQI